MRSIACMVLAAATLEAQSPTPIGSRTGALGEGFSRILGIAELRDGRVVVSDFKVRLLFTGDFQNGAVRQLGRNGEGPGEYQFVSPIFPVAGDTLEMVDFPARRIFRIAPNGTIAETRIFELASTPLPDEKNIGNRLTSGPQFVDRAGVLYSAVQYLKTSEGVMAEGAYIAATDVARKSTKRAAPFQPWYPDRSTRWRAPFLYADVWAGSADGRIARVVPTDYHVEWYRDNQLIAKGPPTAYDRVKVTREDHDAWYAAKNVAGPAGAGVGPARPASTEPPPAGSRPAFKPFTDDDFPEYKPPYVEEFNGRAAFVSPAGDLWVNRVTAQGGKAPVADVFDASGKRLRTVALPPSTRVAGFGRTSVFLIRTDDDGLEWVERYPLR